MTTHQLDIAEELSDRVAIIQKGEIIASSPTRDLIRQFSGTAYTIEVEGELDSARVEALQAVRNLTFTLGALHQIALVQIPSCNSLPE
ncbi:hypothetical protein [Coleofasciculus sp. LEGE 07092]|uniref:hypothetical protein n=1 Tax=Coleofasciculus sp. LEGE 07092 TaxID=2777969 RepID=UPI001D1554C7|nr:hypothetical protein [Coleofasciculus sp. LEGE 07092]